MKARRLRTAMMISHVGPVSVACAPISNSRLTKSLRRTTTLGCIFPVAFAFDSWAPRLPVRATARAQRAAGPCRRPSRLTASKVPRASRTGCPFGAHYQPCAGRSEDAPPSNELAFLSRCRAWTPGSTGEWYAGVARGMSARWVATRCDADRSGVGLLV